LAIIDEQIITGIRADDDRVKTLAFFNPLREKVGCLGGKGYKATITRDTHIA
jgi:hypothetical protein